jgi:hypothetical protein
LKFHSQKQDVSRGRIASGGAHDGTELPGHTLTQQGTRFFNRLRLGLKKMRRCNGKRMEKKNSRYARQQSIQG